MQILNHFETIPAGHKLTVHVEEGFIYLVNSISLKQTKEGSASVEVYVVNGDKKVLLGILSEACNIYQMNVLLNLQEEGIFEVRGKGTVVLAGIYYPMEDECCCGCDCGCCDCSCSDCMSEDENEEEEEED